MVGNMPETGENVKSTTTTKKLRELAFEYLEHIRADFCGVSAAGEDLVASTLQHLGLGYRGRRRLRGLLLRASASVPGHLVVPGIAETSRLKHAGQPDGDGVRSRMVQRNLFREAKLARTRQRCQLVVQHPEHRNRDAGAGLRRENGDEAVR